MLVLELIAWWYSAGFLARLKSLGRALMRTQDNFSIGLALKTLFKPFRQIDASANLDSQISRSIDQKFRHLLDDLISRFIGFWMRLFVILAGILVLTLQSVFSVAIIAIHLAIPLLPIAGIYLTVTGKVPPHVGV